MTWALDSDDLEEIASTFADLGGYGSTALWDETCAHGRERASRASYMREVRDGELPEAQRWRDTENERRRNASAPAKLREAMRKRVARHPELVATVDGERGQRGWGFASAVREQRRRT